MKPNRFYFRTTSIFSTQLKYGAPVFIGFTFLISGLTANAGDILRGGSPASNKPGRAGSNTHSPAATDAARANARDTLARTTRTLDSIRAMQTAARQAALKNGGNHLGKNPKKPTFTLPAVPNGLGAGGLQISPTATTDPTQWTGANLPVQQVKKNGKTQVTIKQTAQQALLNWESFNVGKKTTVTFDQTAGGADVAKWIAFNKINDPSGNPTQILGNIKADGQVYLINTNGIIFGGSSQVNARGLTASSLPINTNLITRGILNNPDAQFLFSGLDIPAGINGTPAFTPDPFTGEYGDITVQAGARLTSPDNAAKTGGRITLVGANVTNNGTISTPDGQTILASGLQVGFTAHSSADPSLRGLDVYVGAVGPYAGTTTNNGIIESPRGSITITGKNVNQSGALTSTTSVALNGRIDLVASYDAIPNTAYDQTGSSGGAPFLYQKSGTVEIGEGSLISILPELDSKETTIGTELALKSQVVISGKAVHLGKDSILLAPNASVDLTAGEWILQGGNAPTSTFIPSSGQVYLDENALVDVSGSVNVAVPVTQNFISVDLRGAELADSPLQREGILRNVTVTVDIRDQAIYQSGLWVGTPLANLSGFANLIQKSVGQLTVAGGTVNISAGSSVVMQKGSKIDVSGGSTVFKPGMVHTTRLITSDGRLVDISQATPDVIYKGIYDGTFTEQNVKFGVSNIYHGSLAPDGNYYDPGSIQGAAGGKLSISAPAMALDGTLLGRTTNGEKQRLTPAKPASLSLSFTATDKTYPKLPDYSPTPPVLTIGNFKTQSPVGAFTLDAEGNPLALDAARVENVQLSPDLMTKYGFGVLSLNNPDGKIILPTGVKLDASNGGEISFNASVIDIEGKITVPDGKLSFRCPNISLGTLNFLNNSSGTSLPEAVKGAGVFTLGKSASISTAGLLVDDRIDSAQSGQLPLAIDGGSISINAFSAELSTGGNLDVSGGASLDPLGKVTYGKGGSLAISTGRDLNITGVLGGHLSLGATMSGFSGSTAGSLSIGAPAIQVGGSTSNPGVLLLQPDFFNEGGFGTFSLTGTGLASDEPAEFVTGIKIASDARIHPIVKGLSAVIDEGTFSLRKITQEEGIRAPGSISFNALGGADQLTGAFLGRGDLLMEQGAVIRTDAKGTVSVSGDTVTLSGSIITPGGSINVAGAGRFPTGDPNQFLPTVLIGGTASLSAVGKTLLIPNALGLRQGQVLAGGSISLTGNIVSERGAVLDVSGTRGILDLPPSASTLDQTTLPSPGSTKTVPVEISSNGGRITLTGAKMLYSDATLIGRAGGSSAIGGTVTVSSGRFVEVGAASNSAEANLVVTQNGFLVPSNFVSRGLGTTLTDSSGAPKPGIGNFIVSSIKSGGFDSLALNGNVKFEGDVKISLPGSLRIATGGAVYGEGRMDLTAAYVNIGQAFTAPRLPTEQFFLFTQSDTAGFVTPYAFSPTHGTGDLHVNADLVDIGNISLQGIGTANFNAKNGDIRGNGTLDAAGSLTFKAGQIYPTTASRFNIFSYDYIDGAATVGGSISFLSGSDRQLPLSAGGTLGVYASRISQGGTLRAPIGTIQLGWDGTGTAPVDPIAGGTAARPVTSLLTLNAGGLVSVSAIDPVTGKNLTIPYGLSLDGNSWIDPAGNDITVKGLPGKTVELSATKLVTEKGSTVDVSGGGDLYAYRWVSGNGGTKDILASSTGFAIIPDYSAIYAPYAPFNPDSEATNLGGQSGYVNPTLKVGDRITLAASSGLPAGSYTLLPARYALLPGAFLITPQSSPPAAQTTKRADGSWIVSGYRSNDLDASRVGATVIGAFEVASAKVIRQRAEYQDNLANTFLRDAALSRGFAVPRLPVDAGHISFSSSSVMKLEGSVTSITPENGRGSAIDINSAANILINDTGRGGNSGDLVLSSGLLNSFGAESLLVGGLRSFNEDGSQVTVNASNLTLDNPETSLTGSDVILVASDELHLDAGAGITGTGSGDLDKLWIGNADDIGSGDGTLVRVSGGAFAPVTRRGVSPSVAPNLVVRRNVRLEGGGIVLDSTAGTSLAESARLNADKVSLNSGQISISLNKPGALKHTTGLVLAGDALSSLQNSAKRLALLSYTTLDIYGTGTIGSQAVESLSLQASAIRSFHAGGGTVSLTAANLSLGNSAGSAASSPLSGPRSGSIIFNADQITLGANALRVEGFTQTTLSATNAILTSGEGSFEATGDLDLRTPLLTGASVSKYQIGSLGSLRLDRLAESSPPPSFIGGIGAALTLQGASVEVNGDITLPSGNLTLRATSGDLAIGDTAASLLDLGGTSTTFVDTVRYTSGGTVNLISDTGSVTMAAAASINVSAKPGGGNAGAINVKAPVGIFDLKGVITGTAGATGNQGEFSLDIGSVAGGRLASLDAALNAGSFTQSRDYRIRNGNVNIDGLATSRIYRVSADSGNIRVSDTIDASGLTGGIIDLMATGNLTITGPELDDKGQVIKPGSLLNASGAQFDSAGKGGSVTLEAGNQRNGVSSSTAVLDLQSGSTINLSVAAANTKSESLGKFSGTLHLRAPRNAENTDLQVNSIGSSIKGASSILVEGVKLYDLTGDGNITSTVQDTIKSEAEDFLGTAGTTTAAYSAMLNRLSSLQPSLDLILAPGAEIYNRTGDLVLGSPTSTATSDWNLETFRFGPKGAAGVLTLRAAGNLTFNNALSDGFSGDNLWLAPLMAYNPLLPANSQSWSLRMTAGADLSASNFRAVKPLESLGVDSGLFQLGKNAGTATATGGTNAQTSSIIGDLYQVIRTGSGDIDIQAGRSLRLLNPFASIYTAGTSLADPTTVNTSNDFVTPILNRNISQGNLGRAQQTYAAQYSMAGGNVAITVGQNIERKTLNNSGLIDDSSRQLPNNWLYRRGLVGPDGTYGQVRIGSGFGASTDLAASTTWWVDFSNFFQDVGALGGGNIDLVAGNNITNVDAVIPTNARAARGIPSADAFVELGGGDLHVTSGNDISGGVYYVERGHGTLNAGGSITTNATRSPSFGLTTNLNDPDTARLDPLTWMPTTLFIGKSSFDLTAAGDLLMGPVANPFLLPQGLNNRFWYRSYFSTLSADSTVSALSLGGDVTVRNAVTLPVQFGPEPALKAWYETQLLLTNSPSSTAWFQPWLRLAETNLGAFSPVWSLSASSLSLSSLAGNVNLSGDITLNPSPSGQLEIVASGSVNGLNPTGLSSFLVPGRSVQSWTSATINLSDANPDSIPSGLSPLTYFKYLPTGANPTSESTTDFMSGLASLFTESGSYIGTNAVLQTRQARHTPGGLHSQDSDPLRIYALDGDLSGLSVFSGKFARISAGRDLTDVSLYLQNSTASDVSVVTAGRDIVASNGSSPSRVAALSDGNALSLGEPQLAGDIQISGPGTLQVLAGRNLDLGTGSSNTDGTGTGIVSIGNNRNPYLPAQGSDLVVAAGIGLAASLSSSQLALNTFIEQFVSTSQGSDYLEEIAPGVDFSKQSREQQALLALEVFYRILRDTGRDYNDPDSPGYRKYDAGFEAIKALFPEKTKWDGTVLTRARDIRTRSGGDIGIIAPGGGLKMSETTIGNPLTPPGIITESGGSISLFADQSVNIGIGRIFTLRGGDVVIWSSKGDIAAGSSSRTIQSAPPTRVVIDPQSASVETDLAGLATGGGIGVLATVAGAKPGDVDLIAPTGIIDAGDAGIRVSGNINLAALTVVNAGNISAGGTSTGTPSTTVSGPSISTVTSASNAAAATNSTAANQPEKQPSEMQTAADAAPSIISVEVIGYGDGGGAADDEEDDDGEKRGKAAETTAP
ncbi:MAG: filamentous hemagglutinin family protein [Luteolibacter sp.]|uniref:filamentous haemagglutinin family protein n=1 Tax=Luteolibacter sp. TaxID=1962973 RepID=UPI003263EB80